MTGEVWRLAVDCSDDLVLRSPLDFFRENFVGKPMAHGWDPPKIDVRGRTKRLRDFVSWMLSAPVLSARAMELLKGLLLPHAELLPLIQVRGTQLYTANVTTLVNCLDLGRSEIVYSPDQPERIMNIHAFRLRADRVPDVPIFKLADYPIDVFVTRPFVDVVRAHHLRGAAFADPSVNPMPLLVRGQSVNVVEGLAE